MATDLQVDLPSIGAPDHFFTIIETDSDGTLHERGTWPSIDAIQCDDEGLGHSHAETEAVSEGRAIRMESNRWTPKGDSSSVVRNGGQTLSSG